MHALFMFINKKIDNVCLYSVQQTFVVQTYITLFYLC